MEPESTETNIHFIPGSVLLPGIFSVCAISGAADIPFGRSDANDVCVGSTAGNTSPVARL